MVIITNDVLIMGMGAGNHLALELQLEKQVEQLSDLISLVAGDLAVVDRMKVMPPLLSIYSNNG